MGSVSSLMHLSLYVPTYHSAGKGWGVVWDYEGNTSPRGGEFTLNCKAKHPYYYIGIVSDYINLPRWPLGKYFSRLCGHLSGIFYWVKSHVGIWMKISIGYRVKVINGIFYWVESKLCEHVNGIFCSIIILCLYLLCTCRYNSKYFMDVNVLSYT